MAIQKALPDACQRLAENHGWRIITDAEWQQRFCTTLKGEGTFFAHDKTNTGFASNKTGEAAWADLCDIAMIGDKQWSA